MAARALFIRTYCESHLSAEIDADRMARFTSETFAASEFYTTVMILDPHDPAVVAAQIHQMDAAHQNRDIQGRGRASGTNISRDHRGCAIYDGFALCDVAGSMIAAYDAESTNTPHEKGRQGSLDIIITDHLICTHDCDDGTYHARMIAGANPVIISIPGIVEAPARPRGYYIDQMVRHATGIHPYNYKKKYDYITRNDPRIADVVEGLILQAVSYYKTGNAFCTDDTCRMYNSHWQSDLIRTQVVHPALCNTHRRIIDSIGCKGGPTCR